MNNGFFVFLLLMLVFMYLLLIRPQRQQQRRHASMIEGLKVGDEVITAGGIYGDITGVESDRVTLEIAEDVEIEVAKRAISSVVPPEDAEEADEDQAADAAEGDDLEPAAAGEVPEEDAARR